LKEREKVINAVVQGFVETPWLEYIKLNIYYKKTLILRFVTIDMIMDVIFLGIKDDGS